MCGIFSIMNEKELSEEFIYAQFMKGQSRGPEHSSFKLISRDNKGEKVNEIIYFGFHRLAINGLNANSHQPFNFSSVSLICNGEIYNYKMLYKMMNITPTTDSDCEIIVHMYLRYGIEQTLRMLDGVFAFQLYDHRDKSLYVARDPYGVRPLFILHSSNGDKSTWGFASELKMLNGFVQSSSLIQTHKIKQFTPGTYIRMPSSSAHMRQPQMLHHRYHTLAFPSFNSIFDEQTVTSNLRQLLKDAVRKRVTNTERPIACLLSGGLDSSLICGLVAEETLKTTGKQIETYSIGMEGSDDLKYAKIVAKHLNTKHTEVVVTEKEFFDAIPQVIQTIESYDTTTVRASVGNYLIAKYIRQHSNAKVIFNGDGADELMGGYLYFHLCDDPIEFDTECRRLLNNISYFDVLRSDKSISSCGLEPRTPFLDRAFTQYYMSIPIDMRCHGKNKQCEKYLIRKAFSDYQPTLIPKDILWRRKEAFSDGVSKASRSWHDIIKEFVEKIKDKDSYIQDFMSTQNGEAITNCPITDEQVYYRAIFEKHYPSLGKIIPYFWMPKYASTSDASARSLDIYKSIQY